MTKGHTSVMASRRAVPKEAPPWAKLEFFPTPPWATRALMENVLDLVPWGSAWEPCAGLGHMSDVLREYFRPVRASDVFLYPLKWGGDAEFFNVERFDFLDSAAIASAPCVDWVITNPPFGKADQILDQALLKARQGVALLLRIQWIEGGTRYLKVFRERGPTLVAPFCERVPMCAGGWDVEGSSATQYCWYVWERGPVGWRFSRNGEMPLKIIPPERRLYLSNSDDAARFGLRHVPGWIAPSKLKKSGRDQSEMEF